MQNNSLVKSLSHDCGSAGEKDGLGVWCGTGRYPPRPNPCEGEQIAGPAPTCPTVMALTTMGHAMVQQECCAAVLGTSASADQSAVQIAKKDIRDMQDIHSATHLSTKMWSRLVRM